MGYLDAHPLTLYASYIIKEWGLDTKLFLFQTGAFTARRAQNITSLLAHIFSNVYKLYFWWKSMQVKELSAKSMRNVIWSKRREEICVRWALPTPHRNFQISSTLESNDGCNKRQKGHQPQQKA